MRRSAAQGRSSGSTNRIQSATLRIQPWRIAVLTVAIAAVGAVLGFRLALYQIVDHNQLSAIASAERSGTSQVPAARGTIYDDLNNPLAVDDEVYDVYASPNQVTAPLVEARRLASILPMPASTLARILGSKAPYPKVASGVSQATATRIQNLGVQLAGVTLQASPNRVYPEGALAAQVLGFVDSNGGQYGLEQEYQPLLAGTATPGSLLQLAHAEGDSVQHSIGSDANQVLQTGATLYLSLDTYVQDIAGQDLRSVVTKTGAASGTVVISDPKTGRVLAMVNYPSFNPNRYALARPRNWSNAAIQSTYEPGSTFKIITMAAGLDQHVITPQTSIYDPGYAYYPCLTLPIHNWDYPTSNGQETMIQVLQHSANVGASYVADLLGSKRFYPYVRAFGVGSYTGIDLAGEGSGIVPLPGVRGSNWTCGNLYTNSYGQALTMTPLQLTTAVNAVANGGWIMRPEVVTRIEYDGITVYRRPHRVRRVISSQTARTLTQMLMQSAIGPPGQYGEASCALVPGYRLAAKTGTANLVANGAYLSGPGSTIASTIAYGPVPSPRFSVLAVIRQPRLNWQNTQWGSETAAPLVHDIFQTLFLHYHVAPSAADVGAVLASQKAFGGCAF